MNTRYTFTIIFVLYVLCSQIIRGQTFWEQTSAPNYLKFQAMFQDENGYIVVAEKTYKIR
jgi:hypothetical protein